MYLAAAPFEQLDLPRLGYHPLPGYTEPIQHALFKWFLPPLGLFAALAGAMWYKKRRANSPMKKLSRNHEDHVGGLASVSTIQTVECCASPPYVT